MIVYCKPEHEMTGAVIVPLTELVLFVVDASLIGALSVAVFVYSVEVRILLLRTVVTRTYHDCPGDKINESEVIVFEEEVNDTQAPAGVVRFVDPLTYESIDGKISLIFTPVAVNHPILDTSKRNTY